MLETKAKLLILVFALFFGVAMAAIGIGFMGPGLVSIAIHSLLVLVPLAAIAWTLRQTRSSA